MPGTLLIRADAGPEMGTGHVMRALAMAHAWRAAGGCVCFVTRCGVESLNQRILAAGAELILLAHPHPDRLDLATMLPRLAEAKSHDVPGAPTWAMLDGYHLDVAYQRAIGQGGARLLVVDDKAHLDRYHADVLVNQNVNAEEFEYTCDAETVLLLGCRYAMLRPEFRRWQSFEREVPAIAHRLLVTLGGADPHNVTSQVVAALDRPNLPPLETRVVIGAANRYADALRRQIDKSPATIEVLDDVGDMPELMAWADVVISAAGITCWELAFMQLPALLVPIVDVHGPIVEQLAEARAATSLGPAEQLTPETIAKALSRLCRNGDLRAAQAAAGRRLVDGAGTDRVVALMQALDGAIPTARLRLRPAVSADAGVLWRLVNDPTVRGAAIGSNAPIPLTQHVRWLRRRLASPGSRLWALDFDGLLLAQIRYDKTDAVAAEVSISVVPAFRRRGLAAGLIEATWRRACEELGVGQIRAIVRQENVASAKTFAKAGFTLFESRLFQSHPCHVFHRRTGRVVDSP